MKIGLRSLPYLTVALIRKTWRIITFRGLLVSGDEAQKRLAICQCCPHKLGSIESGTAQCGICLCHLGLKVRFIDETCPDRPRPRW